MAIKYKGTGKFKYSIDVLGQFPLDTRLIVESKADLTNFKNTFILDEIDVWYVGMIVSCLEDGKIYILKSESEGFVEVGKETLVPIKTVSVDNTVLQIVDGNVNIDLTGYAKKSDIISVYKYKKTETWTNIQNITDKSIGDVYNSSTPVEISTETGITVYPAGTNVAWTGTEWDPLGGIYEQFISSVDINYFKVDDNKQLTISEKCPLINKIEVIKLNGQEIPITEKSVNIVSAIYWEDIV